MKVFITGISGFAGSYLGELLVDNGHEVLGTYLRDEGLANLASIKNKLDLIKVNLLDEKSIQDIILEKKPDVIYHLAALASPSKSFKNPVETLTNNITAEINILEGARNGNLIDTKIFIVASGDMYGLVEAQNLPINENTPFKPTNPYAVSKITQDYLALQYFLTYKLQVIRARPFNHIGPRQGLGFVVADFAKKIIDIEKGHVEPLLKVGNLDAKRDFTDVRDMVKAYALLAEKGIPGEAYNIGSGISHSIKDIVTLMQSRAKVKFAISYDESLMRPSDNPELTCNADKMKKLTGWKPEILLEKTIEDILDYWRSIV